MPKSLSVRARVMCGIAAMLLPLFVLAGTAVVTMRGTLDAFSHTAEETVDRSLPVARLRTLVLRVERAGIEAVWAGEEQPYRAARRTMEEAFVALDDVPLGEGRRHLHAARQHATEATVMLDTALAVQGADPLTPTRRNRRIVDTVQQHTDAALHNLLQAQGHSAGHVLAEYERAQQLATTTRTAIIAATALGLLLALAGGAHLVRSVVRPLHRLRQAVGVLSDGALSHRIVLDRRDEFADLGDALNDMAADLERSQAELAHQALHDALTGLPNRMLLADRLDQALAHGRRKRGQVALLLVDLDGFKAVNDTLGHEVGDQVLCSAAERLRLCLRREDTAARLGGDEFAVLVDADERGHAAGVAERIVRAMHPAFAAGGRELFLSASVGVAFADGRLTGADLLRSADLAMYRAKHRGKDRVCVYDPSMHDDADEQLRLESDLRGALQRDELALHYQPVYSLDGSSLVAVEALMRWDHPERGVVAPAEFIPVAEQSGLIVSLGTWALDEGCRQLRHWIDTVGGRATGALKLSVNLSARQLGDPSLAAVVAQALERHGIEPQRLMLEITESAMVADVAATIARLEELKDLGVQLAIDDFGTGYSSLAYLQQFPIDQIKIDKTFVDRIGSPEGEALAQSIINLARALTLEPIAEGIEDAEQLHALDRLGCRLGQGYHFARPESGDDLGRRLAAAPLTAA